MFVTSQRMIMLLHVGCRCSQLCRVCSERSASSARLAASYLCRGRAAIPRPTALELSAREKANVMYKQPSLLPS